MKLTASRKASYAGYFACLFIGVVCAFDNALNVITYETLPAAEENVVASIVISSVGVAGLVAVKAIGAVLAVSLCLLVIRTKYWIAVTVTAAVQLSLLLYLCFATGPVNQLGDLMLIPRLVVGFYAGHIG